jgi:hypothetical protein
MLMGTSEPPMSLSLLTSSKNDLLAMLTDDTMPLNMMMIGVHNHREEDLPNITKGMNCGHGSATFFKRNTPKTFLISLDNADSQQKEQKSSACGTPLNNETTSTCLGC